MLSKSTQGSKFLIKTFFKFSKLLFLNHITNQTSQYKYRLEVYIQESKDKRTDGSQTRLKKTLSSVPVVRIPAFSTVCVVWLQTSTVRVYGVWGTSRFIVLNGIVWVTSVAFDSLATVTMLVTVGDSTGFITGSVWTQSWIVSSR